MSIIQEITTAVQLLRAGDIGRCELIRGKARISGGDILPGCEVPVSKFFEDLDVLDAD